MTNEKKRAWLSRYRLAGLEVRRLQGELARWEAQTTALTARYGVAPGRGGDDPLQRAVEEILALQAELGEQLRKQVALRREIEGAIRQVEDERLKELLQLRYLEGLTWEKVSEALNLQYRWVIKLHGDALENIEMHI